MKELDLKKEIQAQVEFKMNEFLTALKNRLSFKYQQAFDMTRESNEKWKAFDEISEMMKKEIHLPLPYDNIVEERKRKAKNKAVDKLVESLDLRGIRDYEFKIKSIVSAIELAQEY
jgi:phosphoribosylaminoimidazole carboxylase (NCAIR synthetase)